MDLGEFLHVTQWQAPRPNPLAGALDAPHLSEESTRDIWAAVRRGEHGRCHSQVKNLCFQSHLSQLLGTLK